MDLIVETERLARAGETFICDRLYTSGGGKAGNQAVAAARFAGDVGDGGGVKMIGESGGRCVWKRAAEVHDGSRR